MVLFGYCGCCGSVVALVGRGDGAPGEQARSEQAGAAELFGVTLNVVKGT